MQIGDIVKSIKGRDINNIYMVKDIVNGYCYLIDGKKNHYLKPKKKNLKHVRLIENFAICFKQFKNANSINNNVIEKLKIYK